ncbi:hypothetical protein [Oerskovia sp. KBS0722]|uniref:hypothetical protein n=1 Tax=Oerskovia sp. KBS0722 TaxID=1179673 RepID=UPI00110E7329|nr:hypothetical protein [Oerskovia sp. KBS0722]QDW64336.1 hypothetical protein FFI11_019100 [Oerskovia sp. KBS0722]
MELVESMSDLERALDDRGWDSLIRSGDEELPRKGLHRSAQAARVMVVANLLTKRCPPIRLAYVWGYGVQIQARATKIVGAIAQATPHASCPRCRSRSCSSLRST